MKTTIDRTYTFAQQDVREILIGWLKSKDLPAPEYIGDTLTTAWSASLDGGITVKWAQEGDVMVPDGKPMP